MIYYNEKDDPLSANLFAIDNPKWKQLRHKMTPTFTSGKMKFMYPNILKVGNQFINTIEQMLEKNAVVDIKEMFARFTTDVIGTCAFGIECNSLSNPQAEFRQKTIDFFENLSFSSWKNIFGMSFPKLARKLGITITPADTSKFFIGIVKETIEFREKNGIKRNDFLDLLIDLKNSKTNELTMEECAAQSFVFFLAGFDTSSNTSSFALYELAKNPKIQNKLRQEITNVLNKHNQQFSYESLNEMKYLDQVISGK